MRDRRCAGIVHRRLGQHLGSMWLAVTFRAAASVGAVYCLVARVHTGFSVVSGGHHLLAEASTPGTFLALAVWLVSCALVTASDVFFRTVPSVIARTFVWGSFAVVVAAATSAQGWRAVVGAITAGAVVGAVYGTWYLARPGAIGFADVRTCTVVSAVVGGFSPGAALVVAACAPGLGALWSVLEKRRDGGHPGRRGAPLAAIACGAGAFAVVACAA